MMMMMMINITPTYSFLQYHFALCYLKTVVYIVFIISCPTDERKLSSKKTGKREKNSAGLKLKHTGKEEFFIIK